MTVPKKFSPRKINFERRFSPRILASGRFGEKLKGKNWEIIFRSTHRVPTKVWGGGKFEGTSHCFYDIVCSFNEQMFSKYDLMITEIICE